MHCVEHYSYSDTYTNMLFSSHKGLRTCRSPLALVACDRKPALLHVKFGPYIKVTFYGHYEVTYYLYNLFKTKIYFF
jgi:hypothetical protein